LSASSAASARSSVYARAPTEQLTASQFRREALAVCKRAEAQRGRSKQELIAGAIAFQAMKVAEMHRLKPPADLQADFDAYTQALADRLATFRTVLHDRHASTQAAARQAKLQAQERSTALRLGLLACSQD
jgi:hypothetical protein